MLKHLMVVLAPLFFLAACSTVVQHPVPHQYSAEVASVLTGQAIMGHPISREELPNFNLLAITPEMEAFAEQAVKDADSSYQRVKLLHAALFAPVEKGGRAITYNAYFTEVPVNTFEKGQANCLSFTLLYVALARHVGIDANVNEVEIPPTWDYRSKNSLVFLRHVNVNVAFRKSTYRPMAVPDAIIDLEMDRYSSTYPQRIISDDLTAAQFYSNRGMELLADKKNKEAFLSVRKALMENDQQSYIWNNLGSIYNRLGFYREAEITYLHGLEVNPDDLSIMTNLAGLYRKMKNDSQAAIYSKLAQNHLQANPYYQYSQAVSAFDAGDNENALLYVNKALKRDKREPRFYELAANVYEKMGDTKQAESMSKKAKRLLDKKR